MRQKLYAFCKCSQINEITHHYRAIVSIGDGEQCKSFSSEGIIVCLCTHVLLSLSFCVVNNIFGVPTGACH